VCPVRRGPTRARCVDRAPVDLVDPVLPVAQLVPVHVPVVVPVDRVDPVDSPAVVVEVRADPAADPVVALAVRVGPAGQVGPAVRVVAGASATAPVAAATPQVRSASPVVVPHVAASPSAPSVKSSTTWKRLRSAAFGCRAAVGRPCGCPVALR
jgi:hypothetical protein